MHSYALQCLGFWLERIPTFQQPLLQSTREFFFELKGNNKVVSWSSLTQLNSQLSTSFDVPRLQFEEFDENHDGIFDGLRLICFMPVDETVISAMRLVMVMSIRNRVCLHILFAIDSFSGFRMSTKANLHRISLL